MAYEIYGCKSAEIDEHRKLNECPKLENGKAVTNGCFWVLPDAYSCFLGVLVHRQLIPK